MTQGLVSVVIPAYNAAGYIKATVESVLAQTYHPVEIIVVDDGSKDATEEALSSLRGRIRFIKKSNGGPASARNLGIRESQGEFVAFLDGDDIWEKEKLQKQMAAFSDPAVGMVFSDVSLIDPAGAYMEKKSTYQTSDGHVFENLFRKNFIPTSTVVVRRACLDQTGFFNEDRDLISVEDYDLWLRIAAQVSLRHIPGELVKYRKHPQNISANLDRSYFGEKKVLEGILQKFGDRYPIIKKEWKRRLGFLWYELGRDYFYRGDYVNAKKYCAESFRNDPWNRKNLKYHMILMLGPGMIARLRKRKKASL